MQTPSYLPDTVPQPQNYFQEMDSVNITNMPDKKTFSHYQHPIAHVMPTPSQTPWKPSDMIWALAGKDFPEAEISGVRHFDAQNASSPNIHHKRKSDTLLLDPPLKQFISEEKITAHFNGLHISSNYIQCENSDLDAEVTGLSASLTSTGKNFTNLTFKDYQLTSRELAEKLKNATSIVLNEELLKLPFELPKELLSLPESLYKIAGNPCTALIPYVSPLTPTPFRKQTQSTEEDNERYQNKKISTLYSTTSMDFNNQSDNKMDMEDA